MVWLTNKKTGARFNTDWLDKERQINANKSEANKVNETKNFKSTKFKNGIGETSMEEAKVENGKPNSLLDNMVDGKLSPKRELEHQKIINKLFEGVTPETGQPTFYMTGGGSASGKGRFVGNPEDFMGQKNCVNIDSDTIKHMLPDWDEKDPDCAGYLHEESSALAKRIMKIARDNHYNYLLDGTGDGSEKSVLKKIGEAHNAGYKVVAAYCTTDMNTVFQRNEGRYYKEGRLVPYNMVKGTHIKVSEIFPKVHSAFDSVKLYDSTEGMKLIAEGGGGKQLKILDLNKYTAFLNKKNFTDLPYYYDENVKARIEQAKKK